MLISAVSLNNMNDNIFSTAGYFSSLHQKQLFQVFFLNTVELCEQLSQYVAIYVSVFLVDLPENTLPVYLSTHIFFVCFWLETPTKMQQ